MNITTLKTKQGKFKPIHSPLNIEIEYYRQLRFMVEQIFKRFDNVVVAGMDKKDLKEQIYDADYLVVLKRLLKELNLKINNQFDNLRLFNIAKQITNNCFNYNEMRWHTELIKFGINIPKDINYRFLKQYLKSRVISNTQMITNLKDDVISNLNDLIFRNFENGKTFKEIANEMTDRLGIEKRKAHLIARNEVKNTNTQLNKRRMQEYGVDEAIWLTSDDERVRSEHRKFNNKSYEVGKGFKNEKGEFEEAGESINCRCVAIPII